MSASRVVRRIAATALAAGSVVAVVAMPASADGGHGHGRQHQTYAKVVLGHVQYDSLGRDNRSDRSLNGEWVSVTNTGRSSVNLSGWTLSGQDGSRFRFGYLRLPAHATVRVHTGHGRNTSRDVYQDRRNHVWSNYAGKATLRDNRGRTVDTESWGHRR
ncbi:lamin tail domain-containing protein [Streptomyces sp. NPDC005318]|uniref:lamin tail domain-containing protein n=1 Tax=Streptomyces sp. NPDC005318 TaxID=3157031 RepID=UPI0033A6176F